MFPMSLRPTSPREEKRSRKKRRGVWREEGDAIVVRRLARPSAQLAGLSANPNRKLCARPRLRVCECVLFPPLLVLPESVPEWQGTPALREGVSAAVRELARLFPPRYELNRDRDRNLKESF